MLMECRANHALKKHLVPLLLLERNDNNKNLKPNLSIKGTHSGHVTLVLALCKFNEAS